VNNPPNLDHTELGPEDAHPATEPMATMPATGPGTVPDRTAATPPPAAGHPATMLAGGQRTQAGFPMADSEQPAPTFGRYELLSEIARGGMGVVYRARQQGLDRVVALKMVLGGGGDGSLRQRLLLEAKSAAAMDHPNVVPIYDSGEIDGRLFFTMAFVDGPDLKRYVDARGRLSTAEAVRLFAQIVDGVAHAHAKGVIHRDLKPANVLIDRDGRPRVTDFGLAKKSDADTEMTKTGQVMGTPAYMPPEQAMGRKDVGPAADVYALGGILYYLLTNRPPFTGETATEILFKLANDHPTPPRELSPDVPEEVEEVCLRCLAKAPGERFPDAVALAEAFAPLVAQFSTPSLARISGVVSAPRLRVGAPALESTNLGLAGSVGGRSAVAPPAPAGRSPATTVAALVGGLAVVAVIALFAYSRSRPKADAAPAADATPAAVAPPPPATSRPPVAIWPMPATGDLGLTFELIAPGQKDAAGAVVIPDGTPLAFRVKAAADCYLAVWSVDPAGNSVKLFPNKFDGDGRIAAGQVREMPGAVRYDMTAEATAGAGAETLRVIASTQPMRPLEADEVVKGFDVFASAAGRRRLDEWTRGINLSARETNSQVAQGELKYRVTK
jgi:predicted Ser/Thr protein kinase